MKQVAPTLTAFMALILLAGCVGGPLTLRRLTINTPLTPNDVSFIVKGKTTLFELAEQLGSPDELVSIPSGAIANYHFSDGRYFKVNYGWGLRFVIPFYSPDVEQGGGAVGVDVFQVTFNKDWIVQHHAFAFHASSNEFRFWPFGE